MSFIPAITNSTETLNGALSHKSSLSACLDLFSMGVSSDDEDTLIANALKEDPITAIKVIFYLRDARNGQGNRDIARAFHKIVNEQLTSYDDFFFGYIHLLPYVPQIGYWKDFFNLYGLSPDLDPHILAISSHAVYEDSLACKWFPRQSKLHHDLAAFMNIDIGELRRQVTSMSSTVEQQMCAKRWSDINYTNVPSIANKRYSKAFDRHDSERYQTHLQSVLDNKSSMNASVLYPHEIINMSMVIGDWRQVPKQNQTAEALWKSLPNYMTEAQNVLPVIDVSGSMSCTAYSNYTAMDIALGLGLYFAQHNTGSYKDVWCNFSTKPDFAKLSGDTLYDRLCSINYDSWEGSTDIQAVFERILTFSSHYDIPKAVVIVSDMEFNCCSHNQTNFELVKDKYTKAGIDMPTLIFWRVNTLSTNQPVTLHESGSILINGYSPSIMKLICSLDIDELKSITPMKLMTKAIEPYSYVDHAFDVY